MWQTTFWPVTYPYWPTDYWPDLVVVVLNAERTFTVPAESREFEVTAELRMLSVAAESRVHEVG